MSILISTRELATRLGTTTDDVMHRVLAGKLPQPVIIPGLSDYQWPGHLVQGSDPEPAAGREGSDEQQEDETEGEDDEPAPPPPPPAPPPREDDDLPEAPPLGVLRRDYVTAQQVAQHLGVSMGTLNWRISAGLLPPPTKFRGKQARYYLKADLAQLQDKAPRLRPTDAHVQAEYITVAQLAQKLRIPRGQMSKWAHLGRVPKPQLIPGHGPAVYYRRADVAPWWVDHHGGLHLGPGQPAINKPRYSPGYATQLKQEAQS